MKYSIIYAAIRPEISEQISVGLIFVEGDNIEIKYSKQKLSALKNLFSLKEQKFISKVVSSMKKKGTLRSVSDINYLTKYSNNLLTISPLTTIEIESSAKNKDLLYKNYVYSGN